MHDRALDDAELPAASRQLLGAPDFTKMTAVTAEAVLRTSVATGLSAPEVIARQRMYGRNEIPDEKRHPVVAFAMKFWGVSAWMIELVAVVSALLRRLADVALGLAMLVINAVLSSLQERRASAAVEALRSKLRVNARVLRDGTWQVVPAPELVPGDVLRVRAGDFVPADAKIAGGRVTVDQSALTGESAEVSKGENDLLYSGSVVRRGEATALTILTGATTYYGRTTHLVQSARPRLHVEEVVARVVRWLFVITGLLTGGAFLGALLRGLPIFEILPLLLLLLLSAVPVALPVMFTVSMAVGAMELSRRGVLVTRLSAAEDAATMDVLCADKTGTITQNRLTAVALLPQPGFTEEDVIRYGAMASEEADQDPIDLAFLRAAHSHGVAVEPLNRIEFIPFSPETRRTEAVYQGGTHRVRAMKGALRTLAEACALEPDSVRALEERSVTEAERGGRALAVARSRDGGRLGLVGLAILRDPPRPDSGDLIAKLRDLGVEVKMLTGDALPVAQQVAHEVGLGEVLRASNLRDERSAPSLVTRSHGFAEIFPEDKHAVVKMLQSAGHVVGMTGDGVNDAPALRQAEVGIAVSGATDVAKASASVVLTTEGLTSIVQLVTNGRVVYQRVLTWIANKVSRTIQKSAYVTIVFLLTGRFVISTFGMILLLFMTDFVKVSLATDVSIRERSHFWSSAPSRVLATAIVVDAIAGALLPFFNLPGLHPIPVVQTLAIIGAAAVASLGLNDAVKTALVIRLGLGRPLLRR